MKNIRKYNTVPSSSIIAKNLKTDIHYIDSFCASIINSNNYTIDYLSALLFSSIPGWVRILLKIRDLIVKPFGLQTGQIPEQKTLDKSLRYKPGDKAVFFHVIDRSDSEIVMAEDDKHLYFRTSLLTVSNNPGDQLLYLTTLVSYHNLFGRLYFFPVKPFHKLIMERLLKRFMKILDHEELL